MAAPATFAAMALAAAPAPANALNGHWMNPAHSVIVQLAPCGNAVCGTVTWASEKAQQDARRGVDKLVGAQLLTGFQRVSNDSWRGKVFVPDLNIRVTGKIRPLSERQLKVSGCALGGSLCRSQIWQRSDKAVAAVD
jgi:uncharacterized protein (DUF2147 family)